ncbi:ATP-binding protein, partial [Streptomyces phaeofaciens]
TPVRAWGGSVGVRRWAAWARLCARAWLCVVSWDAGLVQPRRRRARDTDEGGRGLQLVGLLSAAWGSRRTPRGKTVWFELPLPDGETGLMDPAEALLSLF